MTTTSSTRTLKNILIVLAIITAMVISFFMGRATAKPEAAPESDPATQSAEQPEQQQQDPERKMGADQPKRAESATDKAILELIQAQPKREDGDPRALGATDAPVVMVTYEDFSCPMCTVFFDETFPQLQSLVEEGKLRIEFRDLVIFPNYGSDHAARASRAAAEQDKFWEFVETAFGEAEKGGHPSYDKDRVVEIAKTAGVPDIDKFIATYESDETKEAVETETQYAMYQMGITGTPFFIVNNAVISGAQPTEFFINTINQQLEEAK